MIMNYKIFTLLIFSLLVSACAGTDSVSSSDMSANQFSAIDRLLIKTASINIESSKPEKTSKEVQDLVSQQNGYIQNIYDYDKTSISISVRIPSEKFEIFLSNISKQGKVLSKSIRVQDVTEKMIDIEATLKNLVALRDRFRDLLEKAKDVKDILSIETELNRIQTQIDTIESRKKSLKNQVAMSEIDIRITQSTIYGPLGYIGKGIYWVVKKLFVIK